MSNSSTREDRLAPDFRKFLQASQQEARAHIQLERAAEERKAKQRLRYNIAMISQMVSKGFSPWLG